MIRKSSSTTTYKRGDVETYVSDVDADLIAIINELVLVRKPARYTTAERNALTNLYPGLIIYNETTNKLNVYTTTWEAITSV